MSQPTSSPGLGVPLSSNNRANPYLSLSGNGTSLAGVEALNGESGTLAIVGDSSITVSKIGSGQIQISTASNPQAFGAISCSSLTATGAVSGATVSASGAMTSSASVSAPTFNNSTAAASVPVTIASGSTYNVGISGALFTILPSAVAGLSNYKLLRLSFDPLSINTAQSGGNTWWYAITPNWTVSGNLTDRNTITAQAVQYYNTNVNGGANTFKFSIDLPYTAATWPTYGLQFYITASIAGGTINATGAITGVL